MASMSDEPYANVRELLPIEGRRVALVTQHDEIDWLAGEPAFIQIHFEDGASITFVFDEPCGRLFSELL